MYFPQAELLLFGNVEILSSAQRVQPSLAPAPHWRCAHSWGLHCCPWAQGSLGTPHPLTHCSTSWRAASRREWSWASSALVPRSWVLLSSRYRSSCALPWASSSCPASASRARAARSPASTPKCSSMAGTSWNWAGGG